MKVWKIERTGNKNNKRTLMQEFSEDIKDRQEWHKLQEMTGKALLSVMACMACYGLYLERSSYNLIGVPWWEHRRSDWPPLPPLGAPPPPLPDTPPCSASGTSNSAPCSPGSLQTPHCACPETESWLSSSLSGTGGPPSPLAGSRLL